MPSWPCASETWRDVAVRETGKAVHSPGTGGGLAVDHRRSADIRLALNVGKRGVRHKTGRGKAVGRPMIRAAQRPAPDFGAVDAEGRRGLVRRGRRSGDDLANESQRN